MNRLQSQVREFHRTVLNQPHSPAPPELRTANLRARLIAEEAIETICGLVGGAQAQNIIHELIVQVLNQRAKKGKSGADLVEALDGLCDLAVVTYGTAEAIGVDLDPFTDEVMRSNMDKVGGPIDEHGKMGKPPGWRDADIKSVLDSEIKMVAAPMDAQCGSCGYRREQHDAAIWIGHQRFLHAERSATAVSLESKKMTEPLVWFRMFVEQEHGPVKAEARCAQHAPDESVQASGKALGDGLWRKVDNIHTDYRCVVCSTAAQP